jgi:hypothetical protein
MTYRDFRPSIKSGDILAWTHKGIRSFRDFRIWLVRLFTQSEYVHVGVAWCVGERVFILEAVSTGVRIYPLSLDLPCYHLTGNDLTDEQLNKALAYAGQPYSYLECMNAYFGNNNPNDNKWECAEYVVSILGLSCTATPSAVVQHMLSNGSLMTEIPGD